MTTTAEVVGEHRCPQCGQPSVAYPEEVYCVDCATSPEPPQLTDCTLEQLAGRANRAHAASVRAAAGMVESAIAAGMALLAAQAAVPEGDWCRWLDDHFNATRQTARIYMRFARHQELLRSRNATSYDDALAVVRELAEPREVLLDQRRQAEALHADGTPIREIALELDRHETTVWRWLNPKKHKARSRRQQQREREARRALIRSKRERAAKAAGGPLGEAYALLRRSLQQAERAHDEARGSERKALASAIAALHAAEDDFGAALRGRGSQ